MQDDRTRIKILSRLRPGEKLLWCDRPRPLQAIWHGPLVRLPFSLFILGFALFWTWGAAQAAAKNATEPVSFFWMFGLLIVGAGLYQCAVALRAIYGCLFTAYGLTDRRVIVVVGDNGATRSFGPEALSRMSRTGGRDCGTLAFDTGIQDYRYYRPSWTWQPQPALVDIRDPAKVEALIYTHLLNRKREGAAT